MKDTPLSGKRLHSAPDTPDRDPAEHEEDRTTTTAPVDELRDPPMDTRPDAV